MRRIAVALLAILGLWTFDAHAQRREHERERFHSDHWVYDDRFHHNHYYPVLGYSMPVLPPGAFAVTFRGGRYWYHSGVWFVPAGPGYVVARPPVGILVPALPPWATVVYVGGVPYYYANDVYYVAQPDGYAVAEPPAVAAAPVAPPPQAPPPQAAPAPQAAPGTWYYCESAKAYYPYVNECKEAWKQVPATPPGGR
jgi:Family of unknown function (DUF6515)